MSKAKRGNSRYILGNIGPSDIVDLKPGQFAALVLNHEEENALARASAMVKAVFSKAGKRCRLESRDILFDVDGTTFVRSHILIVHILGANE